MKGKTFIASGCSFTFETWCWPRYVIEHYDMNLINVGLGSQGNGLISKKVIYKVQELLKQGMNPDDMFVGIMWSGVDRFSVYIDDTTPRHNIDGWSENPTSVTGDSNDAHWLILNAHWETKEAKHWYGYLNSYGGSLVRTMEYILLTQWFLEKHNIKYFMTNFMTTYKEHPGWLDLPDIKYLYDMIDFSKVIDIDGQYEWVRDNCDDSEYDCFGTDKQHPTAWGHEEFAKKVIIPYMDETYG